MTQRTSGPLLKRALAGIGAAALAIGLIAAAPTAANAAPSQTITGKVTFAGGKKFKPSAVRGAYVLDKNDRFAKATFDWSGNTYTAKVAKPGTYRVVVADYFALSANTPYGVSSSIGAAKAVKLAKGKTVTNNIVVAPNGVLTSGVSVDDEDEIGLYHPKTNKLITTIVPDLLPVVHPGTYKLAVQRFDFKNRKTVITKVFGSSGKSVAKGKTVKVVAAKIVEANFKTDVSYIGTWFSSKAKVAVAGNALPGQTLTAQPARFPAGTTYSYQWYVETDTRVTPLKGATQASIKVDNSHADSVLSVKIVASKRGFLTDAFYASKQIGKTLELEQLTDASVYGLHNGAASRGSEIGFDSATFKGDVPPRESFRWLDAKGVSYEGGRSAQIPFDAPGDFITLEVTYSKSGFQTKVVKIKVPLAGPEGF